MDDRELAAGLRGQLSLDTGAFSVAGAGVIPGHRAVGGHVEGERLQSNADDGHRKTDYGNGAGECRACGP
jgi:hypothetical protein